MLKLLADENFNRDILRGLLRLQPALDILRVQDVGLQEAEDPDILAWAAERDRIVVSHDRATLPDFANVRTAASLPMPGLFIVSTRMPVRDAIEELLVVCDCSQPVDWLGVVLRFPLSR